MSVNILNYFVILSSFLAVGVLLYLRIIYKNERKTKQMSKAAYVLLVAFFLQFVSFTIYSIIAFNQTQYLKSLFLLAALISPYVLGRIIRNFEKVNNYIYFQMAIFLSVIFLVVY